MRFSTSASLIASSSASLVPDPIEKCAVCAASPSRITLPLDQRSHLMRRKLSQAAEPTRCEAFDCSAMAVEIFGEQLLARGDAFVLRHRSKPKPRHVSSEHSTMKVEQSGAKR